ncbi:MAG TPA: aminotransferase class IV [bacterium]|nr:aminotransferase class IV [bacterium]HOL50045.1 aminotransferase class IV [bacterium]HPO52473.1 aminotransferase class IV [bacterium]
MERLVYINGQYYPEKEAKISIFDSSIMLGDTATESTRTFRHQPFKLDKHIERLYQSLKLMHIHLELNPREMEKITLEVFEKNLPLLPEDEEYWIVHNISRGTFLVGVAYKALCPTVMIFCLPLNQKEYAMYYKTGVHAIVPEIRQIPYSCIDPRIKHRSRLHFVIADMEVRKIDPQGFCLLLDIDGNVTENKGANFFMVKKGVLITPSTKNCLAGISRATVLELSEELGIHSEERDITPEEICDADEAFFTSTPYCILPITKFNGRPVGEGTPGKITQLFLDAWSKKVGINIVEAALKKI